MFSVVERKMAGLMFGELFQVSVNICKFMILNDFLYCTMLKNINSDEFNFKV